jgi:serine/threonine protein kinase
MSTFISEPGTRLGGRYRLEDRVAAAGGWAAWKAIDEILARPVTVFTFASGFPRIREVVTAARAASRLSDARLAQVFDVEDDWDHAYIVMEWAAGESLGDLLATGPLDPARGARIVAEAAGALSSAHAAGLAHLCLTPDSIRWSPSGEVKVVGLGVAAALSGVSADDPALADTRGLAKLLYATLTAHWPGPDYPTLPPAPVVDGHPCSPRQVRAGVPSALDVITCRALQLRDRRPEPPITTPAGLAAALVTAAPPLPPPAPAAPAGMRPAAPPQRGREYWPSGGPPPAEGEPFRSDGPGRSRSSPLRVAGVAVLAVVIVAGIVAASLHLGRKPEGHHPAGGSQARHHVSSPGTSRVAVLTPVSAHGFDADNLKDAGDENNQWAPLAIDGNPSTDWYTQWYEGSPYFGGLKHGTGLILDMGRPVRLSSLQITFGKIPGADVQIKVGNSDVRSPATVAAMTTVAQASDVGGTYTFSVTSSARGRYVLIWFTKLPPMAHRHNWYMAEIYNIVVRGSG